MTKIGLPVFFARTSLSPNVYAGETLLGTVPTRIFALRKINGTETIRMGLRKLPYVFTEQALRFATRLIQSAKEEIVIIDPYSDASTLDALSRKSTQVKVCLVCKDRGSPTATEIAKFNKQYGGLKVVYSDKFHDRCEASVK